MEQQARREAASRAAVWSQKRQHGPRPTTCGKEGSQSDYRASRMPIGAVAWSSRHAMRQQAGQQQGRHTKYYGEEGLQCGCWAAFGQPSRLH